MPAMVARKHLHNRQVPDIPTIPDVPSLSGFADVTATANTVAPAATGLSIDTSAGGGTDIIPPTFAPSPPASSPTPSDTPTPTPSAAAASSDLSMSTVVGACLGAFIGALLIIVLGIWFYRRTVRRAKSAQAAALAAPRHKPRPRTNEWNKLAETEDKWEGMHQTKEITLAPGAFKKSASLRTTTTEKAEEDKFAREAYDDVPLPQARQFLGRADPVDPISWDGETIGNESFLSLRSGALSNGAMSPTLAMAIPTPPPVSSEPHHWESAEVVHYEQTALIENPFAEETAPLGRKNSTNPFFNAQEQSHMAKLKESALGKRRQSNPFRNTDATPYAAHHQASDSNFSTASNERAIQSLIAALDVPPPSAKERVTSVQPSFTSNSSLYTDAGDGEDDITNTFPLPPRT